MNQALPSGRIVNIICIEFVEALSYQISVLFEVVYIGSLVMVISIKLKIFFL